MRLIQTIATAYQISSAFEQKVFIILLCLGLVGAAGITGDVYRGVTRVEADTGGEIIEGTLGQPNNLDALLTPTTDADQDLRALIHAGLLGVDGKGNFIPLLAEDLPVISEDLKTYIVKLRPNLRWQDGEPITPEDVIHTIKNIQSKEESSYLRNRFRFVRVDKIDNLTIRFTLREPVVTFSENLLISLTPAHILKQDSNNPVGAGPYKIKRFRLKNNAEISSVELEANKYFLTPPYIKKITIKFFKNQSELVSAYSRGEINSFGLLPDVMPSLERNAQLFQVKLPQYLAVFLNPEKNEDLRELKLRQALVLGTNREEIKAAVYHNQAEVIGGPIVGIKSVPPPEFNPESAKELLDQIGWQIASDGFRYKNNRQLSLLLSINNKNREITVANLLAKQWRALGVNLVVESRDDLEENVVRPRAYQALLLAENIGHDPDPFPFWHSSQVSDPGLNFSMLKSSDIDKVIVQARSTADSNARNDLYAKFIDLVNQASPAIFLIRPFYIYVADANVKNLSIESMSLPYERFSQIYKWYVNTNRVFNF